MFFFLIETPIIGLAKSNKFFSLKYIIKKEATTINELNFYKKVIIMTCTKRIPVVRKKIMKLNF
jgi:hypothetical protein